jgi:hypothetical protein
VERATKEYEDRPRPGALRFRADRIDDEPDPDDGLTAESG